MSSEMTAAIAADRAAYPTPRNYTVLSSGATANGDYPSASGQVMAAGRYSFNGSGVPDGSTVTLYSKPAPHAEFSAVLDSGGGAVELTAEGSLGGIFIGQGEIMKATVTSAGGSTNWLLTLNLEAE